MTLEGETLRGAMVEGGRGVKGLLAPRREIKEVAARQEELEALLATRRVRVGRGARPRRSPRPARRARSTSRSTPPRRSWWRCATSCWRPTTRPRGSTARARSSTPSAPRPSRSGTPRCGAWRRSTRRSRPPRSSATKGTGCSPSAPRESPTARAAAEAAQARHAEARSSLAALRERAAAAENDCRRLEADQAELEQRIAAARARAAETAARRAELVNELAEVERLLAEALLERDRVSGETRPPRSASARAGTSIESREQGLKERRRERDMLRDALAEVDVERARTGSDLDHLARECQQSVGQSAAEAAATLGEDDLATAPEALEAQVAELREKLERMGAVNVLAVEQAQEHEERHAFLTAQRQDLLDSISELDSAIRKIDKASRERFQEAFQVINQHFGETFRQLFGGGTAGLSLLDEEDLLESGIDIMAQPPGKRLQNVMLLSGGEKALTAISLLFAIFQYKPSPFCILDEVDAPLDDANIGRFVKMLEGLKEQTQFVLITHSRKTMSIADQLYGVTMEEPGVSKLVSVRFT